MKQFDSEYHRDYYEGWIYLGTITGKDYYLQALPTKEYPYPCISIVYGVEPEEYISTTISVEVMLDNKRCKEAIGFYIDNPKVGYMLTMIALVRDYAEKHGYFDKVPQEKEVKSDTECDICGYPHEYVWVGHYPKYDKFMCDGCAPQFIHEDESLA